MQIKLLALLIVICASTACSFDKKCSGQLVYDDTTDTCVACPKDSTYKNETCVCKDGYDFVKLKCVMGDGGGGAVDAGRQGRRLTSAAAGAAPPEGPPAVAWRASGPVRDTMAC